MLLVLHCVCISVPLLQWRHMVSTREKLDCCADLSLPRCCAGRVQGWHRGDLQAVLRLAKIIKAEEVNRRTQKFENPLGLQWDLGPVMGNGAGDELPIKVTAAPLMHRLPCWGYVFEEASVTHDHPEVT